MTKSKTACLRYRRSKNITCKYYLSLNPRKITRNSPPEVFHKESVSATITRKLSVLESF